MYVYCEAYSPSPHNAERKVIFATGTAGGKAGGKDAGGGKVAGWRQSLAARPGDDGQDSRETTEAQPVRN
eukprot:gene3816-biopygen9277